METLSPETIVSFALIARNHDTDEFIVGAQWEVEAREMRKLLADGCARIIEIIGHTRIDFDVRMICA